MIPTPVGPGDVPTIPERPEPAHLVSPVSSAFWEEFEDLRRRVQDLEERLRKVEARLGTLEERRS